MTKLIWFVAMVVIVNAKQKYYPTEVFANGPYKGVACSNASHQERNKLIAKAACGEPKEEFILFRPSAAYEQVRPGGVWVKRCHGDCTHASHIDFTNCQPKKVVLRDFPVRIYSVKTDTESCATYPVEEHESCGCCARFSRINDKDTLALIHWQPTQVTCSPNFLQRAIKIQNEAGCALKEELISVNLRNAEIKLNFKRLGGSSMWVWANRCKGSCLSIYNNNTCQPTKIDYRDIHIQTEDNTTCIRYRVVNHVSCTCCYPGQTCDTNIVTTEEPWNEARMRTEGKAQLTTVSSNMNTQEFTPQLLFNTSIAETEGEIISETHFTQVTCSVSFFREALINQDEVYCWRPSNVLIPIHVPDAEIEMNGTRIGTLWIWVKRCKGFCNDPDSHKSFCEPRKTVLKYIPIVYYKKEENNRTCLKYPVEEHKICKCCYSRKTLPITTENKEQTSNETMAPTEGETQLATQSSQMNTESQLRRQPSNMHTQKLLPSSIGETAGESQLRRQPSIVHTQQLLTTLIGETARESQLRRQPSNMHTQQLPPTSIVETAGESQLIRQPSNMHTQERPSPKIIIIAETKESQLRRQSSNMHTQETAPLAIIKFPETQEEAQLRRGQPTYMLGLPFAAIGKTAEESQLIRIPYNIYIQKHPPSSNGKTAGESQSQKI